MVQLPAKTEGGRLECDRIIMADGTAIDLFDENDDKGAREKAHKRSRERQDEVRIDPTRSENLQQCNFHCLVCGDVRHHATMRIALN